LDIHVAGQANPGKTDNPARGLRCKTVHSYADPPRFRARFRNSERLQVATSVLILKAPANSFAFPVVRVAVGVHVMFPVKEERRPKEIFQPSGSPGRPLW
jgi:hypothetical protein